MTVALSSFSNFVGAGKESTYGTAVTATVFTPVETMAFEDIPNYAMDNAMRGSAVTTYSEIPTQAWTTFSHGGPFYTDTGGVPIKGLLGAEDIAGSGAPYTHTFSVLNAGTFQPPSYTQVFYDGFEARKLPGSLYSQVAFTFDPTQILKVACTGMAQSSASVTKPSQSFSATPAVASYLATVSFAGSGTVLVEAATITLDRAVNPIPVINAGSPPMWGAAVACSGSFTAIFTDDTFFTAMRSGTQSALDFTITNGADSLELHMTDALITSAPITQNSNGFMEITCAFTAVANTTDVTTAGTGYSPIKVTLINSQSAAY